MVLHGEVGGQVGDRGQREAALLEQVQHEREAASGAGGADAAVGLALGQPEHVLAIDEERAVAQALGQLAALDLGQVNDQPRGDAALAAAQRGGLGQERLVGQPQDGSDDRVIHGSVFSWEAAGTGPCFT
jgi:hypothetical protein